MAEPKKRGRPRKKKELEEELEIDSIEITKDYLMYVITQFNEGLKSKKDKIIVGSEYQEDAKVDFIIGVSEYIPFLNLLFQQTAEAGHYVYLTIITDLIERVSNLDIIKNNIN